ncbi:MAG: purine-cytosine permease family protein [Candidatus Dormibacteria bacterium]
MTTNDLFRVELRGLEEVPDAERHGHPRELFFIWAAALADFFSFFAGALLINQVGLGVGDSILVLVLGALAGAALLGPMGITGTRSGLPQIMFSRIAFGRRGAYIGGLLTMFIAIGWFAYDCAIAVTTARALPVFGAGPPAWVVAAMLVAMVGGCIAVAVFGHRTITVFQTVQAPTFVVLCLVVAAFLANRFNPGLQSTLHGWPHVAAMLFGFTTVFALIISWATYAGDYSRYLPRHTGAISISFYSGLGSVATLVFCGVLGALVQSMDPKNPDLAGLIVRNIPTGLAWVFVAFIVIAEMSSNYLNIYTASLSGLAVGIPLRRWSAALTVGLLGGAFAAYVLVQTSFQSVYLNFLTATYVWFPAWCAVVLFDYYRARAARETASPRAANWPALAAFAMGTIAALLFFQEPGVYQGALAKLFFREQPADLSAFAGLGASLFLFAILLRLSKGRPRRA